LSFVILLFSIILYIRLSKKKKTYKKKELFVHSIVTNKEGKMNPMMLFNQALRQGYGPGPEDDLMPKTALIALNNLVITAPPLVVWSRTSLHSLRNISSDLNVAVALSDDVIAATGSEKIYIWSCPKETKGKLKNLSVLSLNDYEEHHCLFKLKSNNSNEITLVSGSRTFRNVDLLIWKLNSKYQQIGEPKKLHNYYMSARIERIIQLDDDTLLTLSDTGVIRLWSLEKLEQISVYHVVGPNEMVIDLGGGLIAHLDRFNTLVHVREATTGHCLRSFSTYCPIPWVMAVIKSKGVLCLVHEDGYDVQFYRLDNGEPLGGKHVEREIFDIMVEERNSNATMFFKFEKNIGKLSLDDVEVPRIPSMPNLYPKNLHLPHDHNIVSLLELSDGSLLTGSSDFTIKLWGPLGEHVHTFVLDEEMVPLIMIRLDDDSDLFAVHYEHEYEPESVKLIVWSVKQRKILATMRDVKKKYTTYTLLLHSIRDNKFIRVLYGTVAKIGVFEWNKETVNSRFTWIKKLENSSAVSLCVLTNGWLARGLHNGSIELLDLATDEVVRTLKVSDSPVIDVVNTKRQPFILCNSGNVIKLWNYESERCVIQVPCQVQSHRILALSDNTICTANEALKFWNANRCFKSYPLKKKSQQIFSMLEKQD